MKLKNKLIAGLVAGAAAFFVGLIGVTSISSSSVEAARIDMVDVSNHNGYMTTAEYVNMRNNYGVKAISTKISEGQNYVDPYAKSNIANAQAAGLYINGYHFARYYTKAQAIAEANFACQQARKAGLPVGAVLTADVEAPEQTYVSKYQNNIDNAAFEAVVKSYGYRPDVYTMGSWIGVRMDIANGSGWIANYVGNATGKRYYSSNHGWQWRSDQHFSTSYGNFDASQLYDDYYTAGQDAKNNVKPMPKPSNKKRVDVTYAMHQRNGHWLSPVKNAGSGTNGFAGMPYNAHDMLYIKVNHGSIKYRVHTIEDGWLPWVKNANKNDTVNGVAGIKGHTIDGVQMYYTTPSGETYQQAYYRSQSTQRANYLGTCADNGSVAGYDSWAGVYGEPLDRLQISINNSSNF